MYMYMLHVHVQVHQDAGIVSKAVSVFYKLMLPVYLPIGMEILQAL